MSGVVPLILSLVAVLVLIGFVHVLGFSQRGILAGPDHAVLLAQNLPGGFHPSDIILARDGGGALLCDQQGRLAVVAPIGTHFVVRPVEPGWQVRKLDGGTVAIRGDDLSAEFELDDERGAWFGLLASAAARDA